MTVAIKPGHRGEHEATVKTIARGMPGDPGVTVVTNARVYYTTRAAAGASSARHSLRPLISESGMFLQISRKTCGEIVKPCLRNGTVAPPHPPRHCERQRGNPSIRYAARWIASSHPPSPDGLRRTRAPRNDGWEGSCRIPSRHCEPTGRAHARPMTGSAKQSMPPQKESVDCRVAALLAMTGKQCGPFLVEISRNTGADIRDPERYINPALHVRAFGVWMGMRRY